MNKRRQQNERLSIFVDFANIDRSAKDQNVDINYEDFIEYLCGGRHLVEAIVYVPIDPTSPSARDRECEDLWLAGYFVKPKIGKPAGDTYKCNVDVEMTIDMLNAALDMDVDTIVIVSGDGDFVPVVEYLRGRGIRVEICGFQSTVAREMVLKSSGFIDAEHYLLSEDTNSEAD